MTPPVVPSAPAGPVDAGQREAWAALAAKARGIPLTRGAVALVDAADYDAVVAAGPWYRSIDRYTIYVRRNVRLADGRRTTNGLHNFLTGWRFVDHINGDGLDNRRANLRPATKSQNACNSRLRRNNTSGYRGVDWYEPTRKWRALIRVDGIRKNLGYFTDPIDAARAYDAAAIEYHGEFARLNFPAEIKASS